MRFVVAGLAVLIGSCATSTTGVDERLVALVDSEGSARAIDIQSGAELARFSIAEDERLQFSVAPGGRLAMLRTLAAGTFLGADRIVLADLGGERENVDVLPAVDFALGGACRQQPMAESVQVDIRWRADDRGLFVSCFQRMLDGTRVEGLAAVDRSGNATALAEPVFPLLTLADGSTLAAWEGSLVRITEAGAGPILEPYPIVLDDEQQLAGLLADGYATVEERDNGLGTVFRTERILRYDESGAPQTIYTAREGRTAYRLATSLTSGVIFLASWQGDDGPRDTGTAFERIDVRRGAASEPVPCEFLPIGAPFEFIGPNGTGFVQCRNTLHHIDADGQRQVVQLDGNVLGSAAFGERSSRVLIRSWPESGSSEARWELYDPETNARAPIDGLPANTLVVQWRLPADARAPR
ncbi:MAG: hypothetical protein AAF411_28940 [Myxococcota bacterium]